MLTNLRSHAPPPRPHTHRHTDTQIQTHVRPVTITIPLACRDNDADTEAMLTNLRSHKYQALILDAPVVQYLAAQVKGGEVAVGVNVDSPAPRTAADPDRNPLHLP